MNRIKLTTEVFTVASGEPTHWGVHVFDVNNTKESSDHLVKQILDDHEIVTDLKSGDYELMSKDKVKLLPEIVEKAEKLDQITLRGTRPVTADWIKDQSHLLFDLEQKNKQLEEKLKIAQDQRFKQGKIWLEKNEQLKEIARESLPYLDKIGGAIHLSDKFRKLLEEK